MGTLEAERAGRFLEAAGVAALLLAALVTRAQDLGAPPDLGHAGARLARLVLEERASPGASVLARASRALASPDRGVALSPEELPEGSEVALRLPFFLAGLAAAWALWWVLRRACDAGTAMVALALHAAAPAGILYGGLPGGELPALAASLAAVGVLLGPPAAGAPGAGRLAASGGWLLAAALCVPAAPIAFAPWIVWTLARRGPGAAAALGLACVPAALAALLSSGGAAPAAAVAVARPTLVEAYGALPLAAASLGLALALGRALVPILDRALARGELAGGAQRCSAAPAPLALGGLAATVVAWHGPAGDPALLLLGPGVAAAAALPLAALARPLLGLHAGIAPHALAVATLALPGLAGLPEVRAALRGQPGAAHVVGRADALARRALRARLGRAVDSPDSTPPTPRAPLWTRGVAHAQATCGMRRRRNAKTAARQAT